jgi:hypothetical protein
MTSRRIALAVLVLVAILAGLAGFYLREPPASADSIERIPAYQNEALLARAWVLPVVRLHGPQGYLFQQNQSVCGPTSIADVMRSEGVAADPAAILSRSDALQVFGFLPFGLTLDEEAVRQRVRVGVDHRRRKSAMRRSSAGRLRALRLFQAGRASAGFLRPHTLTMVTSAVPACTTNKPVA